MAREFATVGVVGLGTMGAGISEVFARNGLTVVAYEPDAEGLERGRGHVEFSTGRAVARGKLAEDEQAALLGRITFTSDLSDLAACDLVVEAVPEHLDLKRQIFTALDAIVRPEAVLATNTSSLSVTEISVATSNPRRVVGMHFFNPAPVQKFVEVIRTVVTEDDVVEDVKALADRIGKMPVVVGDKAGFIANALLFGYLNHAVSMYESRYATREDIDASMTLGCGLPMGPLALMDLIGLDTAYEILDTMYKQGRDRLHAPSPILKQMVTAGLKGRKSGRGFYTYANPGSGQLVDDAQTSAEVPASGLTAVGVVGEGEVADQLASRLEEGGYAVTRVGDAGDAGELEGLADVGLVVDARSADADAETDADAGVEDDWEQEPADGDLWEALAAAVGPDTVLTTVNPESAVAIGVLSGRPEKAAVLRMHAPTGNGQAVEIGRSGATDEATVALLREVVTRIGAEPVVCRDRAGLVVDALLMPHLNDAVRMLDEGYAGVADIDTALQHGLGYPIGPFAMIDQIGADEVLAVCEELLAAPGSLPADAVEPSPLLVEHVLLDRPFTSG